MVVAKDNIKVSELNEALHKNDWATSKSYSN
jgi:hypothetical protein